ncbi:MAG TPA: site-specific DNA-methyltransferase [Flavobacterium alvei]|nr:site-specific DNA-methyltransferase [Flavobacterium alvei]
MAKKDYSQLSKEELVALVEKLESRKKYGLVWDEERTKEKFEKESENALPVLKEVKSKEIKTDSTKPTNILIEGDNYHALSVLNYTHQGKIDVIYIDPPYNTGKKDFKYNDKWVDENDTYRHSKWLTFISKRLRLAKNLLNDEGVIFISIDDNEIAQLRLLCNEIFGEQNFINNFMWLHGKGKKTKQSRTLQQYILCYAKNKYLLGEWVDIKFASGSFSNPDNDPRGEWFSGSVSFSEDRSNKNHENYFTIKSPTGIEWTRQWQCNEDEMNEYLKDNKIYFGPAPEYSNVPRLKIFPTDSSEIIPNNILDSVGSTRGAQKELDEIIGKSDEGKSKFENPKPPKLVEFLFNIVNKGKSIKVIDFFAGSGTTGHAVLNLNKKDGGNRQFILCTNNENNICTDVCYPRIQKVIKGYTTPKGEKVDGLGGNLKYFKTAFVKNSISRDDLKIRITRECTEMLCLREGIFDEVKATDDYRIFAQNGRVMGVYYAMEQDSLAQLKKELDKMKGEKILYCFTLDPLGLDKEDFVDWQGVSLEPIPQKILDIYEQIYEY